MGIIYKNGIPYGNQPNGTVPSGGTTGQVLKKVSNTDYDAEWANESGGGGGTTDIAEEYDPISGVYSVGDYCVYQTVLYKCITAISTPEAFDSTKWSETTVGDELNGVKNTLNSKADQSDLASLNLTGTTNTTGSQIDAGTYFYLNGALVKAKVDIADGATFTDGTNYEAVTVGAELSSEHFTVGNVVFTPNTTNVESSSLFIRSYGKIVFVNGYVQLKTAAATTTSSFVIGTIEAGKRPGDVVRVVCTVASAAYNVGQLAYGAVSALGEINLRMPSGNTNKAVTMSFSYIAEN